MPEMLHPRGRRRDLRSPRSDSLDLLIGLTLPFEGFDGTRNRSRAVVEVVNGSNE
jgi:hypothetical protein